MHLSLTGQVVAYEWQRTERIRPYVSPEEPRLKAGSLGAIIGQIKSVCTKRIRSKGFYDFGWQAGYYDHIIRDNKELDRIREYMLGNPYKWDDDEENPENLKPR